jgi:hypothetical protein
MITIAQFAKKLRTLLTTDADQAGRDTAFILRDAKLTGSTFVQTLVFAFMADPEGRLSDLSAASGVVGNAVSPQAIEQRFSERSAACVRQVLTKAMETLIEGIPTPIDWLKRFTEVCLFDGTVIGLPDALKTVWAGCGGGPGEGAAAALKLTVRYDLLKGGLVFRLLPGRAREAKDALAEEVAIGGLRIGDLAYFCLDLFARMSAKGSYWLTRYKLHTAIYDETGERRDLNQWLKEADKEQGKRIELRVQLGARHRLPWHWRLHPNLCPMTTPN